MAFDAVRDALFDAHSIMVQSAPVDAAAVVNDVFPNTEPVAQPQFQPQYSPAPQAPTNMLLEGMRILGPGSLGLLSQGIAAWNQNQADILATERAIAQQQSVEGIITNAINSNTGLGLRGMEITGDLAGQSINRIPVAPPSVSVTVTPSAEAAPVE
jgi:hypothetical protein